MRKLSAMPTKDDVMLPTLKPRAERYPIHAALLYRREGEKEWSRGKTVNISRTGVLFEPEAELQVRTLLEMKITFPEKIHGTTPADVLCFGPVVRTNSPYAAAAILQYRLKHPPNEKETP